MKLNRFVYRADHPAHTDLTRTTAASREHPGRFNTSEFGAIYLSLEPETAIKEIKRNNGELEQCALFVVNASLVRVLDLTNDETMRRCRVTLEDLHADDVSRCQRVAEEAIATGMEAVMWPSATGAGRSLAVFGERLANGSRIEIVQSFELSSAAVRSIDAGASAVQLFPHLRH